MARLPPAGKHNPRSRSCTSTAFYLSPHFIGKDVHARYIRIDMERKYTDVNG